MPIETYKCLIFRGWWSVWMDGLQIRITRCIVIGRLSKQQQVIRRGHSLTPQTFALLPELSCCCFESRKQFLSHAKFESIKQFLSHAKCSLRGGHFACKWSLPHFPWCLAIMGIANCFRNRIHELLVFGGESWLDSPLGISSVYVYVNVYYI
jgi:hypothetical protein